MPPQVKQDEEIETESTLEGLAFALGMDRRRLFRLRTDFPGAPEMHADGLFYVAEWRQWLGEIADPESNEAKLVRLERAKQDARAARAKADIEELKAEKARGEVISKKEHETIMQGLLDFVLNALDAGEEQAELHLAGNQSAKQRVFEIFDMVRKRLDKGLEEECEKAEAAAKEAGHGP